MVSLRVMLGLSAAALLVQCGSSSSTNPAAGGDGGVDAAGGSEVDAATASGACPSSATPGPGLIVTDRGAVRGMQEKSGAWGYLGIPYTAPPVGALRWAAPQLHDCWTGTLDTTAFGARCSQADGSRPGVSIGQEDCLTLNVWAPATATSSSALPVFVFVPGGENTTGGAAEQWFAGKYVYDGADLAAKAGAVVVTLNYRLGALGFLAHPSLGDHAGNYGLLDQLFALHWVQANIAAFGGDRSRVLLYGQSAGADDVCDLVASPLAKGLMSAALMESGRCGAVSTHAAAQATAQTFANAVGCDTAADPAQCMRAVDAKTVTLAIERSEGLSPTIDGSVVNDVPWKVIASGAHNHVPFVVGSNSEEAAGQYPSDMTEAQYEAAALAGFGGDQNLANQALALYPPSDYGGHPGAAAVAASTDWQFGCIARFVARTFAKGQSEPVWRYYFTHHLDNDTAGHAKGAWHGFELLFVFRHLTGDGSYQPSAGEWALADSVDGYWSRLTAGGDPNGAGAVAWPRYDATSDTYLQIDETMQAGAGLHKEQCDFWDKVLGL